MRNMVRQLGGISVLAMACSSSGAWAQSPEDWAAIQAEIAELKSEVKALRAELDAQGGTIAETQQQAQVANDRAVAAEQTAVAAEQTAAAASSGPKVAWKGAPQIEGEGGWSFKPRGRLQYDFAHFGRPDGYTGDALAFNNELRRGRLGVQGDMPGGFGYKFEIDFAGNEVDLTDAFLTYEKGGLTLTAGQHNNFQSLSELTSSLDTSFMERAAFTDAFDFEYRVGLSAQYKSGDVLGQVGVFTANIDDLPDADQDNIGVSGRLVYMPKLGDDTQLHLGASAHYRDLNGNSDTTRYRQRPFLHATSVRFIDTGNLLTSSETNYGLEAAVNSGRFYAASEAHWQEVNLPGGGDNANFFGGYVEGGFFLTDDTRRYKNGVFKGPKISNPVGDGGMGAVQLVARYDYLDLNDDDLGIIGGTQNAYELGVSWWPIDYIRLMLNYAHVEYDDADSNPGGVGGVSDFSTDVVGGRFQVSF